MATKRAGCIERHCTDPLAWCQWLANDQDSSVRAARAFSFLPGGGIITGVTVATPHSQELCLLDAAAAATPATAAATEASGPAEDGLLCRYLQLLPN